MKKLIVSAVFVLMVAIGFTLTGCYRDVIVPLLPVNGPPPSVSFKTQILPILVANCAKAGCHVAGGQKPDMEASVAYTNLINGGYVNTVVPNQSIIYQELNGGPMEANIPSTADVNLIYYWIENGAPNN
ncbi:MAG: hypothetical protein KGM98_05570 [Bacteroidota bacterium]|nr:hypothetical protein [Bacteroidota bacterium]